MRVRACGEMYKEGSLRARDDAKMLVRCYALRCDAMMRLLLVLC